jgi:hypothetical protein
MKITYLALLGLLGVEYGQAVSIKDMINQHSTTELVQTGAEA